MRSSGSRFWHRVNNYTLASIVFLTWFLDHNDFIWLWTLVPTSFIIYC